jgi:adenosylcobinamide-phosphate synthase
VVSRPLAAAAGLLVDRAVGEPPLRHHPVAAFGTLMERVEAVLWHDGRLAGAVHAATGIGVGIATGTVLRSTALATYVATAGNGLATAALAVAAPLEAGDLETARALLPALVGRDPAGLDAGEIARAVVESVAENTVDAVVAPVLWAAALGAPGALAHRAANTMDAMIGHRSARYRRYGTAAARLDDVMAWVPARVTAALVAAVRPRRAAEVLRAVRRDAPGHPSPNAGVAEAAFAAALGLRLGGASRYGDRVEVRPALGSGRPAEPGDVREALRLASDVATALAAALAGAAVAGRTLRQRRAR